MKIIKQFKRINFNENFVVQGTKKELLQLEEILKLNNIESYEYWNSNKRSSTICNRLFVNYKEKRYEYHTHDCGCILTDIKKFL